MYIYANLPDGISHYTHFISQESIYQFYTVFLLIYQQQKRYGMCTICWLIYVISSGFCHFLFSTKIRMMIPTNFSILSQQNWCYISHDLQPPKEAAC